MIKKLLLIEDDVTLSHDVKRQLCYEGYEVDTAFDGVVGEKLILRNNYDCIILDVNMPGKNGFDVASYVRGIGNHTPIIMVTAFNDISDKMQGFQAGVDDYIVKPFFFQELLARIKVVTKRMEHKSAGSDLITIADLVIDVVKKQVIRNGMSIKLTVREFALLLLLAEAQGNPVHKSTLIKSVWDTSYEMNTNTIEVLINILRNKVDKNFEQKLIRTRVGFGYYLGTN